MEFKGVFITSTAVGLLLGGTLFAHAQGDGAIDPNPGGFSPGVSRHKATIDSGNVADIASARSAFLKLVPESYVYGSTEVNDAAAKEMATNAIAREKRTIELATIWTDEQIPGQEKLVEKSMQEFGGGQERRFLTHARLVISQWEGIEVTGNVAVVTASGRVVFFEKDEEKPDPAGQFQVTLERVDSQSPWRMSNRVLVIDGGNW